MENPNRSAFSESVNLTWKWEIGALSLRARPVRSVWWPGQCRWGLIGHSPKKITCFSTPVDPPLVSAGTGVRASGPSASQTGFWNTVRHMKVIYCLKFIFKDYSACNYITFYYIFIFDAVWRTTLCPPLISTCAFTGATTQFLRVEVPQTFTSSDVIEKLSLLSQYRWRIFDISALSSQLMSQTNLERNQKDN